LTVAKNYPGAPPSYIIKIRFM